MTPKKLARVAALLAMIACGNETLDRQADSALKAFIPAISIRDTVGAVKSTLGSLTYDESGVGYLLGTLHRPVDGFDSVRVYDFDRSLLDGWDRPSPSEGAHFHRLTLLSRDTLSAARASQRLQSALGRPSEIICAKGGAQRVEVWRGQQGGGVALAWRSMLGAGRPTVLFTTRDLRKELNEIMTYSTRVPCS